jgi:hypothetical protein
MIEDPNLWGGSKLRNSALVYDECRGSKSRNFASFCYEGKYTGGCKSCNSTSVFDEDTWGARGAQPRTGQQVLRQHWLPACSAEAASAKHG